MPGEAQGGEEIQGRAKDSARCKDQKGLRKRVCPHPRSLRGTERLRREDFGKNGPLTKTHLSSSQSR
jgi:hypothetical protein